MSFFRSVRTTAWGSFACRFCGSILGISIGRRVLAMFLWMLIFGSASLLFGIPGYGPAVYIPVMFGTIALCLYLLEDVVLIERRSFACKGCGYNLEGLTEPRCPECGLAFDPTDRQRIAARVGQPPPKWRRRTRVLLIIAVICSAMSLAVGVVMWRRAAGRAGTPPAASPNAPTTSPPQP